MRGLAGLGPFDTVLDVGGNLGDFAEECWVLWRSARIVSFEPVPPVAERHMRRADGRWAVVEVAISESEGSAPLRVCLNQHSASTMQEPGTVRLNRFGIADRYNVIDVETQSLDDYYGMADSNDRLLVKIDVEGHEGAVIRGATLTLSQAAAVIVEVQQDPDIFVDAEPPWRIDAMLRNCGLNFSAVLATLAAPSGGIVQFDGLWLRLE